MDQFQSDPRSYALEMVEQGLVTSENMLDVMLQYMSHDDVRGALDANELSPRFDENEDEDECEDCGHDREAHDENGGCLSYTAN